MNGYKVPDVIDPGTYTCLKIWIPDDIGYKRAVIGAVSNLCNWFAWEKEDTHAGTLAAAVYRIAYGLTQAALMNGETCDDCGEPPNPPPVLPPEIIRLCGGDAPAECDEMECDNMGCNSPTPPVKIENGNLYYWHCCEWVLIGALGGIQTDIEDTAPEEPVPDDLSCRKAKHMAEMLDAVGMYGWNNFGVFGAIIWSWVGDLRNEFDFLELSKWKCVEAFEYANTSYQLSPLFYREDFPTHLVQELVCKWAEILSPDTLSVSSSEFSDMKQAMKQITEGFVEAYLGALMDAIGKSGFTWVALDAEHDDAADCECPGEGIPDHTGSWEGMDWVHFWDFTRGDDYLDWSVSGGTVFVAGQGFVDWANTGTGYSKTAINTLLPNDSAGGTIKRVYTQLHIDNGFDYSGDAWKCTTSAATVFGSGSPGGDPVSAGGIINDDRVANRVCGSSDNQLNLICEGHIGTPWTDPVDPRSPFIRAVAVGGTGTDPFVTP